MRLIDADRIKDSIMFTCDLGGWIGETLLQIKKLAVRYIENAPTIDAVPVVRCENCIHYESDGGAMMICNVTDMVCDYDDYCSCGKRREDGEE